MRPLFSLVVGALLTSVFMAGCSSDPPGPKIANVDGSVTYNGSPLAGATVTFVPENGPLAMGVTDLSGKFKLATGALAGAAVGPARVSVSAFPPGQSSSNDMSAAMAKPPTNPQESAEYWKKIGEMQQKMSQRQSAEPEKPKSLVPERYNKAESSGLSYTVKPDGDNHFTIELKD